MGLTLFEKINDFETAHLVLQISDEIQMNNLPCKTIGFTGALIFDSSKPDGTPRKLTDVTKLNGLGWKHTVALEDGVNRLYNWYLDIKNG